MKRRIILLSYTQDINNFFMCGLYKKLKEEGHNVVKVFQLGGEPGEDEFCLQWLFFDFSFIEKFKPERIIIFNGFAKESFAATSYLKTQYKTFFCERGWLPQADNIYIDQIGLGARSSIALRDLSFSRVNSRQVENAVNELRESFYQGPDLSHLGDFILVPLQLDHDTSIVLDSPYFKTMTSLMFFVSKIFQGQKIAVTPHPKNKEVPIAPGLTVVDEFKTIDLARYAKAVIGINSTTLIESLVHYKPVAMLGRNVITPSNVTMSPESALGFAKNILTYQPRPEKINNVLFNLMQIQFNRFLPSDLIIKHIIV